ncbi:glycosyltransferase family 4 protein [uncultured Aquimarina sp.]|uniref:glycosyltransferase family 4 protein n=1 Tax=uncultured Aquimarina sp. TaxID=575652 RepID=UPI0026048E90|nr:glycosyltransferase family 4 protein [uncultured Aquimarina sp.]
MLQNIKKALVHDWSTQYRGGERCIESFTNIWNDFDHYTLVNTLNDKDCEKIFKGNNVKTSFIEKLPFGKRKYRTYLPLFPLAIEQFDLSDYELIISSSSCVAKGALTRQDQLHITYMHSPVRYAWDLYHQYLKESGLQKGIKGIIAKFFLHKLRIWDIISANRPNFYIANSQYIAKRIKKIYGKDARVIYPPVETSVFEISDETSDYYVTCSSMVPYKKVDLIVKAFTNIKAKLIVIGDGPDYKKIKKLCSGNIELKGYLEAKEKNEILKKSKAFIFAAEEDFGIAPVEAQACGVPVIAFAKGGVLETIKGMFVSEESTVMDSTGVFYKEQTVKSLQEAISFFEKHENCFDKELIRKHSESFSKERFEKEFQETVEELYSQWKIENNSQLV